MNQRLSHFLTVEKISQSQFADSIGVARACITHIISGRNKPGFDFIVNTAKRYPNLNIEWLLTGEGKMYKTSSDNDASKNHSDNLSNSDSNSSIEDASDSEKTSKLDKPTKTISGIQDNLSDSNGELFLFSESENNPESHSTEYLSGVVFPEDTDLDDKRQNQSVQSDFYNLADLSAKVSPSKKSVRFSGTQIPADPPPVSPSGYSAARTPASPSRSSSVPPPTQLPHQKNVSKVLILFTDGSFQELK